MNALNEFAEVMNKRNTVRNKTAFLMGIIRNWQDISQNHKAPPAELARAPWEEQGSSASWGGRASHYGAAGTVRGGQAHSGAPGAVEGSGGAAGGHGWANPAP